MKHSSIVVASVLVLALVALLAAPAAAEEMTVEAEWKFIDLTGQVAAPIPPGINELEFVTAAPEGAPALPDGAVGEAYARFGIGGKTVWVVLAKSKADAPQVDLLGVDRDGNGQFGGDEVAPTMPREQQDRNGGKVLLIALPKVTLLSSPERTLDGALQIYRPEGEGWSGRVFALWYLQGVAKVGDQSIRVLVSDADVDGSFGTAGDRWLVSADEDPARTPSPFGLNATGEALVHDGHRFALAVKGSELTLDVVAATGLDAKDAAVKRTRIEHEWAERFDKEREEFVKAKQVDTSRPRAEQPIQWRYVTFDEAKAMAAKEGKALFVDIMAFWCVWCYRMDYYTYVDAEVAKLMNDAFVCVKVIQEQDAAGDYDRIRTELNAQGIPAMGIWSADGAHRHTIGGWKKPVDFLKELRIGLDAAASKADGCAEDEGCAEGCAEDE